MTYQNLAQANATSLSKLLVYVSSQSALFVPALLGFFFCVVGLGSYYSSIRMRGYGDFWGSCAVAGFSTFLLSVVMMWIPNFINPLVVITCFVIACICVGFLLTQDREGF